LRHIGLVDQAQKYEMALDVCGQFEKLVTLTGRSDGASGAKFADYVMETIRSPDLEKKWRSYQRG